MRAIPDIVTDTKAAIREIAQLASAVTSRTIFELKVRSSFKADGFESYGEKLLSALREQDYIKESRINYQTGWKMVYLLYVQLERYYINSS